MPSTTNVPNDREDPRDCNPMFKRLPAEVVARRGDRGKKGGAAEKAPAATVELEQVLQKRADGRAKWLAKALIQASDGRLDAQSLYSVVAHNRFVEDLTEKAGNKMYRALQANLHVFSSKQRRFLEKDCALAKKYAKSAFAGMQKEDADEDSKQEQAANAIEDMMARCRAFVRERQSERGERGEQAENGEAPAMEESGAALVEASEEQAPPDPPPAPAEEVKAPLPDPAPAVTTGLASRSRSGAKPKAEEKQATKTKSKKKKREESSSPSRRRPSPSSSESHKRRCRKKHSRKDSRSCSSRHDKKSRKRKSKESDSSDRSKKRKKKKHH